MARGTMASAARSAPRRARAEGPALARCGSRQHASRPVFQQPVGNQSVPVSVLASANQCPPVIPCPSHHPSSAHQCPPVPASAHQCPLVSIHPASNQSETSQCQYPYLQKTSLAYRQQIQSRRRARQPARPDYGVQGASAGRPAQSQRQKPTKKHACMYISMNFIYIHNNGFVA